MASTVTYQGATYTVTTNANAKGGRTVTLYRNGEVVYSINTKVDAYTVVNLQGWPNAPKHDRQVAMRLGREAKALGAKIEYGQVVGVLALEG